MTEQASVTRIEFPGLFDLQVNGFAGVDFNAPDLTADAVGAAVEKMRACGVTRVLPTLITSSLADFAASASVIAGIADDAIAGIHMEGPYLSPDDGPRGAHPRAHIRAASPDDFERRQAAACGRIVLVTLAPDASREAIASGLRTKSYREAIQNAAIAAVLRRPDSGLVATLEAVAGDTVQLKLINPLRPGLVVSPDEGFWYLIMPIRLAG